MFAHLLTHKWSTRSSLFQFSCSFKTQRRITVSLGSIEAVETGGFELRCLWIQQPRLVVVIKAAPPHRDLFHDANFSNYPPSHCHR